MTKNEWYTKLHELAFQDTRLDKIPFVCFEALAEGIANIEAVQQKSLADKTECAPGFHKVVIGRRPQELRDHTRGDKGR